MSGILRPYHIRIVSWNIFELIYVRPYRVESAFLGLSFCNRCRFSNWVWSDLKRELAKVKQERDLLMEAATGWNRQHDGSSDECHNLPESTPAVVLKAKLVYTLRLLIRGTDVCYFASFQPA